MAGEFSVGDVTGTLNFEVDAAITNLARAADALDKIAESSKRSADAVDSFEAEADRVNGTLELFGKGIEFIKAALEPFVDFLKESIAAAEEDELAIQKLNAALDATGGAAASEELIKFAEAESEVSTQSKDAIINVERLLTLLTNGKADIEGATQAALDLSAGLGIDIETAARALGKAMEGNSTALKRFGIDLNEGKAGAEQLKVDLENLATTMGTKVADAAKKFGQALIDDARGITDAKTGASGLAAAQADLEKHFSGSTLSAIEKYGQEVLKAANSHDTLKTKAQQAADAVKAVEDRFGGQAAAEANTYSGLLTKLSHSYEEVQIAVGNTIIKSEPLRQLIQALIEDVSKLSTFVQQNGAQITSWVNSGIELAFAAVQKLLGGLEALSSWAGFTGLQAGFKFLVDQAADLQAAFEGVKGPVNDIISTVSSTGVTSFTNIAEGAKKFGDVLKDAGIKTGELGDKVQSFSGGWDAATLKVSAGLKNDSLEVDKFGAKVIQLGAEADAHPVRPVLEGNKFLDAWHSLVATLEAEAAKIGTIIGNSIVDGMAQAFAAAHPRLASLLNIGQGPSTSPGPMLPAGANPGLVPTGPWNPNPVAPPTGPEPPPAVPIPEAPSPSPTTPTVTPTFNMGGQTNDNLQQFLDSGQVTISGPTFEPQITMSPAVPFLTGIANMSSAIGNFASKVPPFAFRVDFSNIIGQSAEWSKKFGDSLLPSGAFDILSQGTSADPATLRKAINQALEMQRTFQAFDAMDSHLMPDTGSPGAADMARAFAALAGQLQQLLLAIQSQTQVVTDGVSATRGIGEAMASGRFASGMVTGATRNIREQTGKASFRFGG